MSDFDDYLRGGQCGKDFVDFFNILRVEVCVPFVKQDAVNSLQLEYFREVFE